MLYNCLTSVLRINTRHPKKSKTKVTTMNSTDIESSVQQTDKIIAQERHPIPRFSLVNEIEYEIKNHPILDEVARKYNTATENPPAPDTTERNLFFPKPNIPDRIETDYGLDFSIDVQPDTPDT